MAIVTLFTANRYSGNVTGLAQFYGAQTSTDFEIITAAGTVIDSYRGINFTYRGGFFRTGTINEQYFLTLMAAYLELKPDFH